MTTRSSAISVIIPVFNRELYMGEAIASALAQTVEPLEIVVVDDGSTDGSARVAQSLGSLVRCVYQPNAGAAAARNRGAELARGAFLSFLDSDDLWPADRLERQLALLARTPDVDMVCGCVEHFFSPDVADELKGTVHCPADPMPAHGPSTMLIRRATFFSVGLFDLTLRRGESIAWYARAIDLGLRCVILPEVLVRRRLHRTNIGRVTADGNADYLRLVREVLERRKTNARTLPGSGRAGDASTRPSP